MPQNAGYTNAELDRLIDAAGETPTNDAKAAMAWDGGVHSAGLTKDILAMANSQDGGALVIGKRETGGRFDFEGVTTDQAASFDTTKVAQFVNNRCEPPVVPTVYKYDRDGKTFVVITVAEFGDMPVICTRDYPDPNNAKTLILRAGAIYVRTSNTASEPLRNPADVRILIGLATRKQGDQLIASFEAIIRGRPLVPDVPAVDPYIAEQATVEKTLDGELGEQMSSGGWRLSFRPVQYAGDLWPNNGELRKAIDRHVVNVRGSFPPPSRQGEPAYQWGVGKNFNGTAFGMTRTGLFVCYRPFWEDRIKPLEELEGKRWVGYRQNIWVLGEFFQFLARFAAEYEAGTNIRYTVTASGIRGRIMTDSRAGLFLTDSDPSVEDTLSLSSSRTVEELRSDWDEICTDAAFRLVDLFYGGQVGEEAVAMFVDAFAKRQIY